MLLKPIYRAELLQTKEYVQEEHSNNNINRIVSNIYDKVMVLKVFVDSDDNNLKNMYYVASDRHNNKLETNPVHIDAGFDLFAPGNEGSEAECFGDSLRFFGTGWTDAKPVNKLDLKVCCSAKMFTDAGKNFNVGEATRPKELL